MTSEAHDCNPAGAPRQLVAGQNACGAGANSRRSPPRLQLQVPAGRRSADGCSSACETASDLSALASPFAYAERVRERLERTVPRRPPGQLDQYLEGHTSLKLRAGGWGQSGHTLAQHGLGLGGIDRMKVGPRDLECARP